jgi:hypothetical protein
VNVEQATDWFLGLPGKWQDRFLALLIHNLTVAARDTYVPQSDEITAPARLKDYNEVIHRVTGFFSHVIDRKGDRYAGDFWIGPMLLVPTDDKPLDRGLVWAFKASADWIDRQLNGPESIRLQDLQTPKRIGA